MRAPCVGYFDHDGKWYLITSLVGQPEDPKWKKSEYTYLQQEPKRQPVAILKGPFGGKNPSTILDRHYTGKRRAIKLDLKSNAMMAGELGPSFEWSKDQNRDALGLYTNEDYGSRIVAFWSGLSFKRRERYFRLAEESSSDIISTKNGTDYEVSWSSILDEVYTTSDDNTTAAPKASRGGSKGDLDIPSSSLANPYRPSSSSLPETRVICDGCEQKWLIPYYHYSSCRDFDLCGSCVSQGCKSNSRHQSVQVKRPNKLLGPSPETVSGKFDSLLEFRV
ncbi:MAG: hypothetical protein Q9187_004926 [Circinaria calcarea]